MTTARLSRAHAMVPLLAVVLALKAAALANAQQPVAQPPPQIAAYRPPIIALVQPVSGGTVPQDRPVIVLRFSSGEPGDALDVSSFRVVVDGNDRTGRFQVNATEAWGAISEIEQDQTNESSTIALGAHQIAARICSSRGACSELSGVVIVTAPVTSAGEPARKVSRKERVVDALMTAVRRLLQSP